MDLDYVSTKKFPGSFTGYNRSAVDEFIDELVLELDKYNSSEDRIKELEQKLIDKDTECAKLKAQLKILAREVKRYRTGDTT